MLRQTLACPTFAHFPKQMALYIYKTHWRDGFFTDFLWVEILRIIILWPCQCSPISYFSVKGNSLHGLLSLFLLHRDIFISFIFVQSWQKWVLGCPLWLLPWCGLKLPLDGGDEDASSRSRWERNTYVEDRNNDLTFDEFNMRATLKEVHCDIRDVLEYGRVHWHFGDSIMVRDLHKTGDESVNDVAQWVLLLHGSAWPSLPSRKGRWKNLSSVSQWHFQLPGSAYWWGHHIFRQCHPRNYLRNSFPRVTLKQECCVHVQVYIINTLFEQKTSHH